MIPCFGLRSFFLLTEFFSFSNFLSLLPDSMSLPDRKSINFSKLPPIHSCTPVLFGRGLSIIFIVWTFAYQLLSVLPPPTLIFPHRYTYKFVLQYPISSKVPHAPSSDISLNTCFTYLLILPLYGAFCCRLLRAASGIALLSMPGWASLWLLTALSTLSSLRQAKINWADSEVGAVSRFTRFTREIRLAWGFSSQLISLRKFGFHMKPLHQWPPLLYKPPFKLLFFSMDTTCTSGSGVGATFGFHQSPRSFLTFYCIFILWRRCFPLDFTGALFCTLMSSLLLRNVFCLNFVAFLHVFVWISGCITSSGDYGHSVSNTFVQLTEGRSARDLPKQPPAKKSLYSFLFGPAEEHFKEIWGRSSLHVRFASRGFTESWVG